MQKMRNMLREQEKFLEYAKSCDSFNKEIKDYINSLIMLETSVLKSEISEEKMQLLMNVALFRNLVKFNIYQGTIKLFCNEGKKLGLTCGGYYDADIYIMALYDDIVWIDNMRIKMKNPYSLWKEDQEYSEYFSLLSYKRRYDQSNNEQKNIILDGPSILKDGSEDMEKYKEDMRLHFTQLFEQANGITDEDYLEDITKIEDEKNEQVRVKTYKPINVNIYKKTIY